MTTYPLAGVAVAASSSPTLLTLEAVTSATGGLYKCEVSGGPPRWRLVIAHGSFEIYPTDLFSQIQDGRWSDLYSNHRPAGC